jgi:hypothetical protein
MSKPNKYAASLSKVGKKPAITQRAADVLTDVLGLDRVTAPLQAEELPLTRRSMPVFRPGFRPGNGYYSGVDFGANERTVVLPSGRRGAASRWFGFDLTAAEMRLVSGYPRQAMIADEVSRRVRENADRTMLALGSLAQTMEAFSLSMGDLEKIYQRLNEGLRDPSVFMPVKVAVKSHPDTGTEVPSPRMARTVSGVPNTRVREASGGIQSKAELPKPIEINFRRRLHGSTK